MTFKEVTTVLRQAEEPVWEIPLPLFAWKLNGLNNIRIDEFVEVVPNRTLALTGIRVRQFLQRGHLFRMRHDILNQHVSRLLRDEVQ